MRRAEAWPDHAVEPLRKLVEVVDNNFTTFARANIKMMAPRLVKLCQNRGGTMKTGIESIGDLTHSAIPNLQYKSNDLTPFERMRRRIAAKAEDTEAAEAQVVEDDCKAVDSHDGAKSSASSTPNLTAFQQLHVRVLARERKANEVENLRESETSQLYSAGDAGASDRSKENG